MNPTVTVMLTDAEVTLLRAFASWKADPKNCSPKKWQIESGHGSHRLDEKEGRKAFANLVTFGLIEHSRNGHCWLLASGKKAIVDADAIVEAMA